MIEELILKLNVAMNNDDSRLYDSILDELEKILPEDEFIKLCESL